MEFRLATKLDLNAAMCQEILAQAIRYSEENEKDDLLPYEILNIFINFSNGQANDPQFWLGFKEEKLVGYVITMSRIKGKEVDLYIRQAFIDEPFRGNGVAGYCLDVLEKKAKQIGYKRISLETYFNPKIYERFIRRYGYGYISTEYKKEI